VDGDLCPQTVQILLTYSQRPLLKEIRLDGGACLLERRSLQTRLILLIPERGLGVCGLGDFRGDVLLNHGRLVELAGPGILREQLVFDQPFHGDAARLEQCLRQLHRAEIPGRLL